MSRNEDTRRVDIGQTLQEAVQRHGSGDVAGAMALYRQVLSHAPGQPDALHFMGIAHLQTEHHQDAVSVLTEAARAMPGNADVHSNLGVALRALGREAEAAESFRRALSANPLHSNAVYNLAIAQRNLGQRDEAIETMRDAVVREPGAAERHCDLAGLLLETGRGAEAIASCDACLERAPHDALAMSYRATALAQTGNREGAESMLAMDRVLQSRALPLPSQFSDTDSLCDMLLEFVLGHPTLKVPVARATTHGRQTAELLGDSTPASQALAWIIDTAVGEYLAALPVDDAHPYLAARPNRWDLTAWGVVLDDRGHQASHAHPTGWVSGVFYLAVPDRVREDDPDREGWIEFGRPPEEIPMPHDPPVTLFTPRRARMVLFPAYLYHRTIPFRSDQRRVSIAFDARPYW